MMAHSMKREYGLNSVEKDRNSVVTVGSFDGVHLGHQAIIQYLVRRARAHNAHSVAISFEPHPREVLTGEVMPLLTTIDERADYLEALGLDRFIILEFTREFAARSAEDFVTDILVGRIGVKEIVVGYDHRFGRGRKGDTNLLKRMGLELGFDVDIIPAQAVQEDVVSSSRIRTLLTRDGDVRGIAAMLARAYTLDGTIVRGAGRGRTIGFPTANIRVANEKKVVPRHGVYAVRVRFHGDDHSYSGMMNIGVRPTVDGKGVTHLEVHLFDFDREVYSQDIQITFVDRLRDERKFASLEDLVVQLQRDERISRSLLGV